jgi:large subunit ribosomal protein L6
MSRIGLTPIDVPQGVDVTFPKKGTVTVKGPKGELIQKLPDVISFEQRDGQIVASRLDDDRVSRAMHGLARQLVANMIVGVTDGYEKRLEIRGTGYRAQLQGSTLDLQLGFTHPQRREMPEGIEFELPDPTHVVVRGIDKQLVGHVAAELRAIRPADAYKGHGIRYEGEYVRRKPGKSAVAIGAPV